MTKLSYLNVGCGYHYHKDWVNVDFIESGPGVIAHNLLNGIPFNDNSFEVVYHSHVLEHFPKDKAAKFIEECYLVLKPGGVIRIAVPDLEQIVNNYTRLLALGKADDSNKDIRADYDWILTEMYDQTVRNTSGGEMLKILSAETLDNENFILQRIGNEGYVIRQEALNAAKPRPIHLSFARNVIKKIKRTVSPKNYKELLLKSLFKKEYDLMQIGKFRQSGEIHQWMYDVYSLSYLLKDACFKNPEQKSFNESNITDWRSYGLDEVNNIVRKPDSLFIEAIK